MTHKNQLKKQKYLNCLITLKETESVEEHLCIKKFQIQVASHWILKHTQEANIVILPK